MSSDTLTLQLNPSADETGFVVLLYYKFVPIESPQELVDSQRELCERLGLLGRILVGAEGLNGTVSGSKEATDAYMEWARSDSRFEDMPFKIDSCESHLFPKLSIRTRKEIVTLGLELDEPVASRTGRHLSPAEWQRMLQDSGAILIDGRSDYEFDLGRFPGAIRPDAAVFKDFPKWLEDQRFPKDKVILTYCTGGIRCEKLTAYLLQEGYENSYQLSGGIINYGHDPEVRGADFEGRCYVFDQRISVPINQVNPKVVGVCYLCGAATEEYVNCANVDCNRQFLACSACEKSMDRCCSESCILASRKRPKGGKLSLSEA